MNASVYRGSARKSMVRMVGLLAIAVTACALALLALPQAAHADRVYHEFVQYSGTNKIVNVGKMLKKGKTETEVITAYLKDRPDFDWDKTPPVISEAKSSNESVASIDWSKETIPAQESYAEYDVYTLAVKMKKPGTAKLSCTIKTDKVTHKWVFNVTTRSYSNPVNKFKIGKKSLKSKISNKKGNANVKKGKYTGKLGVKLKKNWSVDEVRLDNKKISVGKKVKLNKKGQHLRLVLRYKKTGCIHYIDIFVK